MKVTILGCTVVVGGLLWMGPHLFAQVAQATSVNITRLNADADAAWAKLSAPIDGIGNTNDAQAKLGYGTVAFWQWEARRRQQYRELGLSFWALFPEDTRRNKWFITTVRNDRPYYWKDLYQGAKAYSDGAPSTAIVDEKAKLSWSRRYVALRSEYLHSPVVSEKERSFLRDWDLGLEIDRMGAKIRGGGGDLHLKTLDAEPAIWHLASEVIDANSERTDAFLAKQLYWLTSHDSEMESAYLAALSASSSAELIGFAQSRKELLRRLRSTNIDLKLPALMGGSVSLADSRNRVVLVDIWGTYCESCWEGMPRLEALYKKYHPLGFDIMSVCCMWKAEERLSNIAHLKNIGVSFPVAEIVGVEKAKDMLKPFGFEGSTPNYFLFDKRNYFVTADIDGNWLEFEIRRLLGMPRLDTYNKD